MNNIEKFWSYLGEDIGSINERQLLRLICLLGREHQYLIEPQTTEQDLLEVILNKYNESFETSGFNVLTEEEVLRNLKELK